MRDVEVARLLGARHLAQALISAALGRRAMAPGAAVDAIHAASMLATAAAESRMLRAGMRRAELADAVFECLLAGLGFALS